MQYVVAIADRTGRTESYGPFDARAAAASWPLQPHLPSLLDLWYTNAEFGSLRRRLAWPRSEHREQPLRVGAGAPTAAESAAESQETLAHYRGVGPRGSPARLAVLRAPMSPAHLWELAGQVQRAIEVAGPAFTTVGVLFEVMLGEADEFVRVAQPEDRGRVEKKRVTRYVHAPDPFHPHGLEMAGPRSRMYLPVAAVLARRDGAVLHWAGPAASKAFAPEDAPATFDALVRAVQRFQTEVPPPTTRKKQRGKKAKKQEESSEPDVADLAARLANLQHAPPAEKGRK